MINSTVNSRRMQFFRFKKRKALTRAECEEKNGQQQQQQQLHCLRSVDAKDRLQDWMRSGLRSLLPLTNVRFLNHWSS